MPANSRNYQNEYMKPLKLAASFCRHSKTLLKLVKEITDTLSKNVKEGENPLPKNVKTLLKLVKDSLPVLVKSLPELVKVLEMLESPAKPDFIGSASFCGQDSDHDSDQSRAGGVGGVSLACNNVTCNINSNFKANLSKANKEENFSKEKKEKKEEKKEKRIPKEEYWEMLKNEFLPFYACYPQAGRLDWLDCVKRYKTIRKSLQRLGVARFCGVVEYLKENAWNDYPPKLLRFLHSEDWRRLPIDAMAGIERSLEAWENTARKRLSKYKINPEEK